MAMKVQMMLTLRLSLSMTLIMCFMALSVKAVAMKGYSHTYSKPVYQPILQEISCHSLGQSTL